MHNGIEFHNITKRYGTDADAPLAVNGISFVVKQGTLTTILGPSGCGKTTALRMIAGLEMPTSGSIIMGGKDVTIFGPAQRNVSMMFQSYALFPHMNVIENVSYGLKMSGIAKPATKARALEAMKNVGLVALGPLNLTPRQRVHEGAVKVAVRPEAWQIGAPGTGLAARLGKSAYLGSNFKYTFETELGAIFVVSPDLTHVLSVGASVGLSLAGHAVSVVQVS